MAVTVCSTAASADGNEANTIANVPVPRLQTTIELSSLGPASVVKKMAFSPDGRFLAIVINPTFGKTDIVVWDLQLNRKQSHIHSLSDYGDLYYQDLLWWPDGKVISFGIKQQWDPMSGDALPDNPAVGRAARLNKDGSKMLTIAGSITGPSYIHIYNTVTWELQRIYVDGFRVETAAWTTENKIVVGVRQTKDTVGQTIDNYRQRHVRSDPDR
jgi:WD40 repeat protein